MRIHSAANYYGKSCVDSSLRFKTAEGLHYGQSTDKKQYYIPMEVNSTTIKDFGINPADVEWTRIGHRRVRVIMVPATKEQYYEYMRPLWAEDKRRQRQELATSPDKLGAVSLEELWENTEYEVADTSNLEETMSLRKPCLKNCIRL